ncbi:tRNA pseudouridine(38-40) synthase TruA [Clostridium aminobutyricum]|uniref:tRNA pseudouridine synthase A n=1 Tax=Clostridium aminobutyricum TaxID=33953 RepID=A0A939D7S8_CLOAM|nr:tRNA pseudouridine(38-40) synthase TruA [Clostridium aminobutyricum]
MRNILLTIEYDGTNFCGWQRQPDKRSVQGEIEKALSIVCGAPVSINGTSRTDAGVHALGQRANFRGEFGIPTDRIGIAVNNILAGGLNSIGSVGDVQIVKVEEKKEDFHARFDAKGKKYVYKILNSQEKDIFGRNYYYQINKPLDVEAMKDAAKYIIGTHDFKCFQAAGGEEKATTVRTIFDLKIFNQLADNRKQEIELQIKGDGFLYNMVRIITGTLVDVGLGKRTPLSVKAAIDSKDRQKSGHTAPPQGLYLYEVYYDLEELNKF